MGLKVNIFEVLKIKILCMKNALSWLKVVVSTMNICIIAGALSPPPEACLLL